MRRRGETEDQWRARMETKAERQRYFSRMDRANLAALHSPPSQATVSAQAALAEPRRRTVDAPARGAEPPRVASREPKLRPCTRCGAQMRSSRRTLAEVPGTVQHGARGMCSRCAFRGPRKPPRPDYCVHCKMFMRKSTQTLADVPNSVQHGNGDTCQPCLRKKARGTLKEAG